MSIPEPKVEHHEGRSVRSCPIFPELRPILDEAFENFGDKSEYVVAAPQYRAAASTAMSWKNSNLRTDRNDATIAPRPPIPDANTRQAPCAPANTRPPIPDRHLV